MSRVNRFIRTLDLDTIVVLSTGTLLSGLIPLLFEPYLKSNFTPEEYGSFDVFLKSIPLLALIHTLKNETLISSSEATKALLVLKSTLNQTFITFLVFLVISLLIGNFTIIASVIGGFLFAIITAMTTLCVRKGYKIYVAFHKPVRRFSELLVLIIILSFSLTTTHSLIKSSLIGLLATATYLILKLKKEELKFVFTLDYSSDAIKSFFRLKHLFLGEFLNILSLSYLTYFVYWNYSKSSAGILELTGKFISVPQLLFSSVFGIVIQNRVGSMFSDKINMRSYLRLLFLFLILVSSGVVITYFLTIDFVIVSLFSKEWHESANWVKILLPQLYFFMIFSPFARVLYGLQAQVEIRNWYLLKSILVLSTAIFYKSEILTFLSIYVVFSCVAYVSLIFFVYQGLHRYEKNSLRR